MEWTMIFDKLEQKLCDSLRDRVCYRFIKEGSLIQFCIFVDHQIWFQSLVSDEVYHLFNDLLYNRNLLVLKQDIDQEVHSVMLHAGYISSWDIPQYLMQFLRQTIDISLTDDNDLIRLLAILDRRVCLKDLYELRESVDLQPLWLKKFYLLRMQVEHIDIYQGVEKVS